MQSVPITTKNCAFESRSGRGVQHYMIQFVSGLRQDGGFLGSSFSSNNKTDRHDINDILLNVALSTITQATKQRYIHCEYIYIAHSLAIFVLFMIL